MPDFNPVNPTSPIPPTPRPHRDKRRRQSEPQPKDDESDRPGAGNEPGNDNGDEYTIDEYA